MKALRRFTVRAAFPAEIAKLAVIVDNLRWTWHQDSRDLLESVDPGLWQACNNDPNRMLGEVTAERLAVLAADEGFVHRLESVHADLQSYLNEPRWYQQQRPQHGEWPASIGYFSPEFGITEVLPQYSGGLGILAGDHLKAASDLGIPLIGVGLLYRSGYFRQSLSRDGWQLEQYPALDPQGMPIHVLHAADGNPLHVRLDLPENRTLSAQIWVARVGRVPLLLLDSDIEENDETGRQVTDRLYGGGTEHRLEQELLLGIGGVRAIRAYCRTTGVPAPTVFHTNEGHAGFLGAERIRELIDEYGLSFDEALQAVRAGTVFTTHTPVPAGIDRFPRELVETHMTAISATMAERVLELGAEADPTVFNMAHMGLRIAQRANGVSQLHGRVSREMFAELWPNFDARDVPIGSITNGVHGPTWTSPEIQAIVDRGEHALDEVSDWDLWQVRRELRGKLVDDVRQRVRASGRKRGMDEAELAWTADMFDPNILTVGFARRVPSYKRLTLMLRDPERLRALLLDPDRPVQFIIAGKAHPADDGGKELIAQIVRFADDPAVRHRIAFLPNYDIGMARNLYWGVDVWLNNPLRPLEACGTSGMKAALNGALNLSIRDGWWDEWCDGDNGWAIPSADGVTDPDRRDDLEAEALYDLIGNSVVPRFYDVSDGSPRRWVEMVRHTLKTLGPKVQATRMVLEYTNALYIPAAAAALHMADDNHKNARTLAAWRNEVVSAWPGVRVLHVESHLEGEKPLLGQRMTLRAEVALNGLSPDDVDVEAVYGAADSDNRLSDVSTSSLRHVDVIDSTYRFEGDVQLNRTGGFGFTVRVLPKSELLASPADLGVLTSASPS